MLNYQRVTVSQSDMFDAHKNQTFLTGAKRRESMGMGGCWDDC